MSQSGSILSRTIKFFTGDKYNHISLSLDENLKFLDAKCRVIEINISDEQYDLLCKNIMFMLSDSEKYKYNLLGLFLSAFHICFHPDNKFYCSEFVRYILDIADIDVSMIPTVPHPVHFMRIDHGVVSEGLLKDYSYIRKKS